MGFWFVVCGGVATPARVTRKKKTTPEKLNFWTLQLIFVG